MSDFQNVIDRIFDQVYVVSLPRSKDRRDHIRRHFSEIGLTRYVFFDALDAEAPEVTEAFHSGQVATYPPCFRCGALRCGNEDCNNVLIPPQIANFCTYRGLWTEIAATPQRALVVEDDVVFEPDAVLTLERLARAIASGEPSFVAEVPRLLRLGWAHSKDHNKDITFRLSREPRMSNPCHGLTSAYARALLERFDRFGTTSDVYMHRDAPNPEEAVTVFPPLASELSWSTGAVTSLIHPKEIRSAFLEARGQLDEAHEHARRIHQHVKHIHHRPLLILGHPRAGLEEAHAQLRQGGLDVGYQQDGRDGLCSWTLAADTDYPAADRVMRSRRRLHWTHLIHIVRNPQSAVPQIVEEQRRFPAAHAFRRLLILHDTGIDIDACKTEFECAVLSLALWSEIISKLKPNLALRVEDGISALHDFLSEKGGGELPPLKTPERKPSTTQVLPPAAADWAGLTMEAKARLSAYCNRYGYQPPDALTDAHPKPATAGNSPKISVIIPIYGTEAHVEKCLRSVMNQTLREIEIICVDDASPDNSAALVEQLAAEDNRIRLIRHARNLGLGGARNTGIEAARAPYLTGVDSDDYILPEMMEKLWDATEDQTVDIVVCGMGLEQADGGRVQNISRPEGRYRNDNNDINILDLVTPSFCNKLWRSTLFTAHGIRFPEHLYYEDLATTPRLLRHAKFIRVIRDPLYRYVTRDGSIMNRTSARHIMDYFRVYDILGGFLHQENLWPRHRDDLTAKIGKTLHYHSLGVMASKNSKGYKLQYLRHMMMLKLGYLEHQDRLRTLDTETLKVLIRDAESQQDVETLLSEIEPKDGGEKAAHDGKTTGEAR